MEFCALFFNLLSHFLGFSLSLSHVLPPPDALYLLTVFGSRLFWKGFVMIHIAGNFQENDF